MGIFYRMLIGFLLGGLVCSPIALKIGYNLPRDPVTEVNVSVDKLKANKGSQIDFTNSTIIDDIIAKDSTSRKERRKLNKRKKGNP